jgi:hypothetical protein
MFIAASMENIIHSPESFAWSYTTLALCLSGWTLHWLASWGQAWKKSKITMRAYVNENAPVFYFSIIATCSLYIVGPDVLTLVGLDLQHLGSNAASTVANLGAFAIGYIADSVVYKLSNIAGKSNENS